MTSAGQVYAAFEHMRINHPRIPLVHKALDDAREAGRLTGRRPKRFIEFFAPSHSGKSMAIRSYIETVVVPDVIARGLFPADMDVADIADRQTVVVHVTLSPKATPKTLAADILRKLGDKRADKGTKDVLLSRLYTYLETNLVELVILDEIQHLSVAVSRTSGKASKAHVAESTDVTDTLKRMMIEGLVPMVFVGIPEAREHLSIDPQLTNRELSKIDFSPLRWSVAAEQAIFLDYCAQAGMLIQEWQLLPGETDFLEGDIPHMLWASTSGCIGIVSRLAEQAVLHAIERGGDRVLFEDLAKAVDTRGIPNGMCTYNPFRSGVRQGELY